MYIYEYAQCKHTEVLSNTWYTIYALLSPSLLQKVHQTRAKREHRNIATFDVIYQVPGKLEDI